MPKIRTIEAAFHSLPARKKVAAYARVSMESDNLIHSLSAQVSYYNDLIQKNPDWIYVGVYADRAVTGTKTAGRDELKRLLEDCDEGKIDIILVKSISRFARNTVDTLEMVRYLRNIGVEVRFERENISNLSGDGELMLTILASFAEEESRSISQNVRWGIRKRFEQGIQNGSSAPYGYRWDGEMYRKIPGQAETVRYVFDRYLAGASPFQIRDELIGMGVRGRDGGQITDGTIRDMVSNISYTGVQVLQKNYIDENHKRIRNRDVLPKYMVEDMFEPIVTMEEFEKAQEIKRERMQYGPKQDVQLTGYSGRMICGYCGAKLSRRTTGTGKKWCCNSKERKGNDICDANAINEKELDIITDGVLGNREFKEEIESIKVFNERLEYTHFNRRKTVRLRTYETGKCDAFSRKMFCGCCGKKVNKVRDSWIRKGERVTAAYCRCQSPIGECSLPRLTEEDLLCACSETLGTELEPQLMFARDVRRLVFFTDRLEFEMREGGIKTWQRR